MRRPALFLDRDGVLNRDHGYVGTRERWEWVEGARETVALATHAGWLVFVVTNQSGIARGYYTETDLQQLMGWVAAELQTAGGVLNDWRYCPHHPQATVAAYRRNCACRKPAPGMLLDLLRTWQPDEARSLVVGDSDRDLQAAQAANLRALHFPGGNLLRTVERLL